MFAAELLETQAPALPDASVPALWDLRKKACELTKSFKLQSQQRFLRRVLSPDSPNKNLLLVHGTGVGKSCTAIQVAEEYILRPEFRDKKVLVLANPAVQENFKREIFDVNRVNLDKGILQSPQCTGRRYLEILERIESTPARWSDPDTREKLGRLASRIIDEFYEFQGYIELANSILSATPEWIEETFSNRLVIVDEAHNLRARDDEDKLSDAAKRVSLAMETLAKTAKNMVLVCLTATPMYDNYTEILYYFNLFLWNDGRLSKDKSLASADYFTEDGSLQPETADTFRGWVQDYVSFVKGESPFTFPFRLPPPPDMLALPVRVKNPQGNAIPPRQRRTDKGLPLVGTMVQGVQAERLKTAFVESVEDRLATIAVPPEPFKVTGKQYEYTNTKWLAPSQLPTYAAKFATVLNCIKAGTGVCMVYSNFVEGGAKLFAMALEEAGFRPLLGSALLVNPALEGGIKAGSAGVYTLITQDTNDTDLRRILTRVKQTDNKEGALCKVIVTSPRVSEGVDFRFIRQVHILDPWFNMSRLEQVVGRGMRTCSHSRLDDIDQNCTIYYHVCRQEGDREVIDESIYRRKVEMKAVQIAKVRRVLMESAMDCPLQLQVNALDERWRGLAVDQRRSQDGKTLNLTLEQMMAPTFDTATGLTCAVKPRTIPPSHVRPLSTYLDVRDEILDELQKRFHDKPVWTGDDLRKSLGKYQSDVVTFLLQDAVRSGIRFTDSQDRLSVLQSRGVFYALVPADGTGRETAVQRLVDLKKETTQQLPEGVEEPVPPPAPAPAEGLDIAKLAETYDWKGDAAVKFSPEVRQDYIVDAVLTPEQRRTLLTGPPNRWNAPLEARIDTDRVLRILGPKEFQLGTTILDTPIGEVADAYEQWITERKQRFLQDLKVMSATFVPGEGLKVWTFDIEDGVPVRKTKEKSISPTAVKSIKADQVVALARWLDPIGFPTSLKSKEDRIPYLYLLIRKAGSEKVRWWTPEEWAVLESQRISIRLMMREK